MHVLIVMDGSDMKWIEFILSGLGGTFTTAHDELDAERLLQDAAAEEQDCDLVLIMDERISTPFSGVPREETGIRLCEHKAARVLVARGIPVVCGSVLYDQWHRGSEMQARVQATGAKFMKIGDVRTFVIDHFRGQGLQAAG